MALTQATSFITVRNKRFHYIWLRENCPSCRYPAPYQQLSDPTISDRPNYPHPLSIDLSDEYLTIDWDETPSHRSVFPIDWLLENSYDDPYPPDRSDSLVLWTKATLNSQPLPAYSFQEALTHDRWIDQLCELGFVVIKKIPPPQLESFLTSVGPIYNVDYGHIFALETKRNSNDLNPPKDGCALPPHNDLSYWGGHHLAQFLYCVENQSQGGQSILVDGFQVTQDFCQAHPNYCQLLCETPVQFWLADSNHRYLFRNVAPVLECDGDGKPRVVRFSKRNCRPQLPFEQLETYYDAYHTFFDVLKRKTYQHQFLLEPQDCLLFQNFRILHGRTAFDPDVGNRQLQAGYVDWNFFSGRRRFRHYSLSS